MIIVQESKNAVCENCSFSKTFKTASNDFLMLRPSNKDKVQFRHLFNALLSNTIEDYRCEECNYVAKYSKKFSYSYKFNKFIVLKLNTVWNNRYTSLEITHFNPDNFEIPLCSEEIKWKIKAVIFFEPICKDYLTVSGHYICAVRDRLGWIEISDNSISEPKKLRNNLKNAYLIFLERL